MKPKPSERISEIRRPKPSGKWPEKKPVEGQRIDVEREHKIWNSAVDACQAAVEAAGLERKIK